MKSISNNSGLISVINPPSITIRSLEIWMDHSFRSMLVKMCNPIEGLFMVFGPSFYLKPILSIEPLVLFLSLLFLVFYLFPYEVLHKERYDSK